ncbi:AGAP005939-PA [Anopheles gambiae str. PEST]|uniref:DNA repair protein REV1 n=1 Tax=Anopheles gambiae TaxID=7165 RepID=Q7Q6B2_ANOGA|nr:AGAP005939-PA [Anopheles gambiae str. PEST]
MKRKEKLPSETGFEGWGDYMDAKIAKLEDQFRHSSANVGEKQSDLFAGVSIFVNGYTNPSADELKRLMMMHGGVFHHYKRPNTTYTIATILPDVKVRSITSEIIISPRWVVDCLKEGKLLDYSRYLLYTQHKPSQPKLAFSKLLAPSTSRTTDITKPVVKNDGDPNDISRTECLNVLGMLKNFSNMAPEPTVSFESEEQTKSCDIPVDTTPTKASLTATDPNFLTEFFNNSRLHHIATLGAGFKQYVAELREKATGSFPARDTLVERLCPAGARDHPECDFSNESNARYIMHIDMDCFFVSVGLRKYPHLRGLPVAVTHSRGSEARVPSHPGQNRALEIELYHKRLEERYKAPDIPIESRLAAIDEHNSLSEIASCSYEARQCGVKNGMFVGAALKLCPELKTIPYDFDGYREVAHQLYDTIARYTLDIEAVSCDEMFVDLTELLQSTGVGVMEFVTYVRNEISTATGCDCSAGIGANRLQARMATKRAKPNGQYHLVPGAVEEYMKVIPIAELPGVGPSTSHRLRKMTYVTCADLQTIPKNVLQTEFGKKFGETLYNACRGIDERPLVYDRGRKSVSVDVNYGIRFSTEQEVERFMRQLTQEIHRRLVELRQRGKLVTVKLLVRSPEAPVETAKFMGHGLCDVVTKSQPLRQHTDDRGMIEGAVLGLMRMLAIAPSELRGIGIQISKFEGTKHAANSEAGNRLKSMFQKVEDKRKPAEETVTMVTNDGAMVAESSRQQHGAFYQPDDQQPCTSRSNSADPAKTTQSVGVMRKFLIGAAGSSSSGGSELPAGLDPEVLAALPEDIREEAIRDYRRQQQQQQQQLLATNNRLQPAVEKTPVKVSPARDTARREWQSPVTPQHTASADTESDQKIKVDLKFLQALPLHLRLEVEKQIELNKDNMVVTCNEPEFEEPLLVTPDSSPAKELRTPTKGVVVAAAPDVASTEPSRDPNILRRKNWRELVEEWINSAEEPYEYDVLLLAENGLELLSDNKSLDQLYLFLRYLHRLVKETASCFWHRAYCSVVRPIQEQMLTMYGRRLAVPGNIDCELCNEND